MRSKMSFRSRLSLPVLRESHRSLKFGVTVIRDSGEGKRGLTDVPTCHPSLHTHATSTYRNNIPEQVDQVGIKLPHAGPEGEPVRCGEILSIRTQHTKIGLLHHGEVQAWENLGMHGQEDAIRRNIRTLHPSYCCTLCELDGPRESHFHVASQRAPCRTLPAPGSARPPQWSAT